MHGGDAHFKTDFGTAIRIDIDEGTVGMSLTELKSTIPSPADSTVLTPREARLLAGVLSAYADEAEL